MTFSTTATTSYASDPAQLVRETVAKLKDVPVRAGVLFVVGAPGGVVAKALAEALPGVPFAGATCKGAQAGLLGLWFTGEVHVAVASGAVSRTLAESAIARGGFKPFQARLAVLLAKASRGASASLFEVLPKSSAFFGAEVTEAWTHEGLVDGALFVSDWPTQRAVGFEGLEATLQRKGIARETVVGSMQLEADEVLSLYGVPDRSPESPRVATLVVSRAVDRAD